MAVSDFIPTIWAARFTEQLYKRRVYGLNANRNYEGNASGGKVKVPTHTTGTSVASYTEGTAIAAATAVNGTMADLNLDQQKYFHLIAYDISRFQANADLLDAAVADAVEKTAQLQDTYLMGIYAGAFANGRRDTSANTAAATNEAVVASFFKLQEAMSKGNVPEENRWIVVSPSIRTKVGEYLVKQGSASTVNAPATTDDTMRNGFAGKLAGFDVRVSNNIPTSGSGSSKKLRCIASQGNGAVTMAEQMTKIEAYRPDLHFADAVKGLYVYGALASEGGKVFYNEFDDPDAS